MARVNLRAIGLEKKSFDALVAKRFAAYVKKPYPPVPSVTEILDLVIPIILTPGHDVDDLTGATVLGDDLKWDAGGMDGLGAALDGAFSRWDIKLRGNNKLTVALTVAGVVALVHAAIKKAVASNDK